MLNTKRHKSQTGLLRRLCLLGALLPFFACQPTSNPRVVIETDRGAITAEIYLKEAPISAGQFLKLVDEGYYNRGNAIFYRVTRADNQPNDSVKIDVIQGGLYQAADAPAIAHETTQATGLHHLDGTLSMARAEPGTASSEFFICIGDQPELDFGGKRNPDGQGFAVFGQVTDGMSTVKSIQALPDQGQYLTEPVLIRSIRRLP